MRGALFKIGLTVATIVGAQLAFSNGWVTLAIAVAVAGILMTDVLVGPRSSRTRRFSRAAPSTSLYSQAERSFWRSRRRPQRRN